MILTNWNWTQLLIHMGTSSSSLLICVCEMELSAARSIIHGTILNRVQKVYRWTGLMTHKHQHALHASAVLAMGNLLSLKCLRNPNIGFSLVTAKLARRWWCNKILLTQPIIFAIKIHGNRWTRVAGTFSLSFFDDPRRGSKTVLISFVAVIKIVNLAN